MTAPLILHFSEISSKDIPIVGGKGANLGELINAGFPVPHGFCLTTVAFDEFITSYQNYESLFDALDQVSENDLEGVRTTGKLVRDKLYNHPIPSSVINAILDIWEEIGPEFAYAVRSSATAEDLPDASFAGQQDTFLNVIGKNMLLESVKKCWVSLFSDRAIIYRTKNNFSHRTVKLCVVVQKMIFSEKSGILFTADPLSGHRHTLVIDAGYGLGEALVSGIVIPDSYVIDKKKKMILERKIFEKNTAIYPLQDGGTVKKSISGNRKNRTTLNDKEILDLTELAISIENHYTSPQDIEWAIVGKKIFILQSRPITSLYPIDGLQDSDGKFGVFFSSGHQQNMTRAMSPLGLSTLQVMLSLNQSTDSLTSPYLKISGSRLFINVAPALRHHILKKMVLGGLTQFYSLAPLAMKKVMKRPEFKNSGKIHISFSSYRFAFKTFRRVLHSLWKKELTRFTEKTNQLIDGFISEISQNLDRIPPRYEMVDAILKIIKQEVFPFFLNWIPEAGAGIVATRLIEKWGTRWLSSEEIDTITLGLPGNVVNEMNMMIGDIADIVREYPPLVNHFRHSNIGSKLWFEQIEELDGNTEFLYKWNQFLKLYGARGSAEIDISMPRWYEDPTPVLRVIKEHLVKDKGSHRRHQKSLIAKREEAYQTLLRNAGNGFFGKIRKMRYKRLYYAMTQVGGMREHHKFTAVQVLAIVKEKLKNVGEQLVKDGKLSEYTDIWFLTWPELLDIWENEELDWKELISERKTELEVNMKLSPPAIITSDGESPIVNYEIKNAPENSLVGHPVSSGIFEGIVHVIQDPRNESLAPGEILVAQYTDPGWTPLFINASALVLVVGGTLTHGAVVAREYGIPAVVGVKNATKLLVTGQRIKVDGNRGIIEILS